MTSRQFIDLLEDKLHDHGVKKVIPDETELGRAYRLFVRGEKARKVAQEALKNAEQDEVDVPPDLEQQVSRYLEDYPEKLWDDAVSAIVSGGTVE